ncbi:MAG: hypothetical protein RI997_1090, partial [Pseudomonadota bacterium]
QPRMNDLLRGRIDKFSLDALMILWQQTRASLLNGASQRLPLEWELVALVVFIAKYADCA